MRLTKQEVEIIKSVLHRFTKGAEIYLFGSRTRDDARGGNIDILLLSDEKIDLNTIIQMKMALEGVLGEQKIDIVRQQRTHLTSFGKLALREGIRL